MYPFTVYERDERRRDPQSAGAPHSDGRPLLPRVIVSKGFSHEPRGGERQAAFREEQFSVLNQGDVNAGPLVIAELADEHAIAIPQFPVFEARR